MKLRPALFWDTKIEHIDLERHARYIIERVAELGRDDEVRWVLDHYDPRLIQDTIARSRSVRPRTRALWTLLVKN